MIVKNLDAQVQKLIDYYCSGSLSAFSKKIKVPQSTLQRYMAAKDTDKLFKIVPQILKTCPEVDEMWLYSGEGEMLCRPRPNRVRTAENSSGELLGDLLWEAFRIYRIDEKDLAVACELDNPEWMAILGSHEYPSFKIIQALYDNFRFNPLYLFIGQRCDTPFLPKSMLEIISYLLGKNQKYIPSGLEIETWFGCDHDDAKQYLSNYRKWINIVNTHGIKYADEHTDGEPLIKNEWIDYFCSNTSLKYMPIKFSFKGILKICNSNIQKQLNTLEKENNFLKEKNQSLQEKIQVLQEKIIQLQDSHIASSSNLSSSLQDAPIGDTVAPITQQKIKFSQTEYNTTK